MTRGRRRFAGVAPGDEGFPFPPWQRPAKQVRDRAPLTRDRIVEVALRIIDAESTEAVSMRRIAADLETGAASLYAHVSGKDEVLQLAHERVLGEMRLPDVKGQGWDQVVRAWAWEVYRVYGMHADIARLSLADIPTGPHSLDLAELLMRAMIDGGVPAKLASWALDRVALYVGADVFEGWLLTRRFAGDDNRSSTERGAEWFAGVRDYMRALPVERFPTLVSNVDAMMNGDGDQRFAIGVDLLIEGIRAMAVGWPEPDAD